MSDVAARAQIETGAYAPLYLVRFDFPGLTRGYHTGGRPYAWNGLTYKPNRFLKIGTARGSTGPGVTRRKLVFNAVPENIADDPLSQLESIDYLNAPVIITTLVGRPMSNEVVGVRQSLIYKIVDVDYPKTAQDENGLRAFSIVTSLEPLGRTARGSTQVSRSQQDQNFDNDATDTCLEYASTVETVARRWGQILK